MRRARAFFSIASGAACVLLGLLPAALVAGEPEGGDGPYPGFEVRYEMAPLVSDLVSLLDNPTVINTSTAVFGDPLKDKVVLEGQGDAHAIYDLPVSLLLSVIRVNDGSGSYAAGVLESHIDEREGERTVVSEIVGTTFLGIRVAFPATIEVFHDKLPAGGEGIRSRLMDSPDGKLYESSNSWYLVPVDVMGRKMTYVRFHMRSGIYSPFPGEENIMRAFMPKQLNDMFTANIGEARRRAGLNQGGESERQ